VRILDRLLKGWIILLSCFCFLAPFASVCGAAGEEPNELAEILNFKDCEGVTVTQCEVAKNLMNTLKMGEDLTCGACFIHLRALGIAPGEDWSYEDPHKVITQKEMKELILETNMAFQNGTVRLDGFEAAVAINSFCRDMKGPVLPRGVEAEEGTPTTSIQEPGMEKKTSE
jgi:hypothetical protein